MILDPDSKVDATTSVDAVSTVNPVDATTSVDAVVAPATPVSTVSLADSDVPTDGDFEPVKGYWYQKIG